MRKGKTLILSGLVIFLFLTGHADALEPKQGKCIWQKAFDGCINSVAVDKDNSRIFVAVESQYEKKDDPAYHRGKRYEHRQSKVFMLNDKGEVLWSYEQPDTKGMYMFARAAISADGSHAAVSLYTVHDEERTLTYRTGEVEKKKFQEFVGDSILYFDSSGKLLWSRKTGGRAKISQTGEYVLIVPDSTEDGKCTGDFYYVDRAGNALWTVHLDNDSPAGMTDNGDRVFIGDTLYGREGNVIWHLDEGVFTDLFYDGKMAVVALPEIKGEYYCSPITNRKIVDVGKKSILCEFPSKIVVDEAMHFCLAPFSHYYIDEKNRLLVTMLNTTMAEWLARTANMKTGEVKVYDLFSGKLVKKNDDPLYYTNYVKARENSRLDVKAVDNMLYCYTQ